MSVSWREAIEALDWVRLRLMNRGSPDFLRQGQAEARVQALCARLLRDKETGAARLPKQAVTSGGARESQE